MSHGKFTPMKGEAIEDVNALVFPVIASPKLDGFRCVMKDGQALSYSLKPIRNRLVQAFAKKYEKQLQGLDGELMAGDVDEGSYNRTQSFATTEDAPFQPWAFHCFDAWGLSDPYKARLAYLKTLGHEAERLNAKLCFVDHFRLVPAKQCRDVAELLAFEKLCLEKGYEGVMVRKPDGPYKCGRSTIKEGYLLKLKRFTDEEAVCIGWEERMSNQNEEKRDATGKMNRATNKEGMVPCGDLGALLVRGKDGVTFKIGTGFTAAQRKELWAKQKWMMNRLVKFKHQESGAKDAPRFPVFLGFRDEMDV